MGAVINEMPSACHLRRYSCSNTLLENAKKPSSIPFCIIFSIAYLVAHFKREIDVFPLSRRMIVALL